MIHIVNAANRAALQNSGRLLIGYFPAGYPDSERFLSLMPRCETAGTDIFEIGFPSGSPEMDGEVIRKAHEQTDHAVATSDAYWKRIRKSIQNPLWLMGYAADLVATNRCEELAALSVIDALVVPDLTLRESADLRERLAPYQVDVLGFIRPDMDAQEVAFCLQNHALIYQQLYSGQTGEARAPGDYLKLLATARSYPHTRVFAGFGISTPERVHQILAEGFDGAIVGTEMLRRLNESESALMAFIQASKTQGE